MRAGDRSAKYIKPFLIAADGWTDVLREGEWAAKKEAEENKEEATKEQIIEHIKRIRKLRHGY